MQQKLIASLKTLAILSIALVVGAWYDTYLGIQIIVLKEREKQAALRATDLGFGFLLLSKNIVGPWLFSSR